MMNLHYKQLTNGPACAIIMTTESCNSFHGYHFDTLDNSFKGYYSVFCVLKNVHDCENEEKRRGYMYRCLRCGGTYDSNELTRTLQYRGEYQGTAAYETERSCPACGYDVEYCGEWSDDGYDYDELL